MRRLLAVVHRAAAVLVGSALAACGGGGRSEFVPTCTVVVPLSAAEVTTILEQAANRALLDGNAFVFSVTNREGVEVGAFGMGGTVGDPTEARRKALTAAFLSSNQHSFNTRTAAFIIDDHFPPGLSNTPGGPLYGVQFSALPCSDVVGAAGTVFTTGLGLSGDPGSIPLYKGGCLVGALGADGGTPRDQERAAWAGALGFRPDRRIFGSNIFIDGVSLRFVDEMPADAPVTLPFGVLAGAVLTPPMAAPPPASFPPGSFGGLTVEVLVAPMDSPAVPTPKLLSGDVSAILDATAALSDRLRAGIRRPLGSPARMFIAVVDTDGVVLGLIRTPEATFFSLDVAVQKARTAAFFSSDLLAISTRALGFLAQGFFPPGLDGEPPGPLAGLQDVLNPLGGTLALP
ncbi:MAG: heme-binding protein, partial [Planctomycetota bacterium]